MLRQYDRYVKRLTVSIEEETSLQAARRDALAEATKLSPGSSPLPIRWRVGWSAHLEILGRDRDGSLLARVRVSSPQRKDVYRRKLRLVRSHSRPSVGEIDLRLAH